MWGGKTHDEMAVHSRGRGVLTIVSRSALRRPPETQRNRGAQSGIRHRLAEPGGRGRFKRLRAPSG